jgi:protein O-GlcNAc transferase
MGPECGYQSLFNISFRVTPIVTNQKLEASGNHARIVELLQMAKYAEAEKSCRLAFQSDAKADAQLWLYFGASQQFQGKVAQALEAFQQACLLEPGNVDALNACASCYDQLGKPQEAFETAQAAFALAPGNSQACSNLAVALEQLDKPDEALAHYNSALQIDPYNRTALINRGTLLARLGRRSEGLKHNRHACELLPDSIEATYNLVDSLIGLFQYEEALSWCNAGLAQQPRHAHLLFKKGLILSCIGDWDEAQQMLSYAQTLEPQVVTNLLPHLRQPDLKFNIYIDAELVYLDAMYQEQARCYWGHRAEYVEHLRHSITQPQVIYRTIRNRELGFQIFSLELDAKSRLQLGRSISECVQDFAWLNSSQPFAPRKNTHSRLRIGYVSPDFRFHPVGLLTCKIYQLHDRNHFEIYGYSLTVPKKKDDDIYKEIANTCDVFRDVHEFSDQALAKQIHDDEIDILVDLAGYTAYSKSEVFAMCPAPLQVAWLGYPGTMGADFMDYAIIDSVLCPAGDEPDWHEKPIKLPNTHCPYDTGIDNSETVQKRAAHGLPEDAVVFCCFNTNYKIEPTIFSVWVNILKAVPGSVLWLVKMDNDIAANLRREATARGLEAERLIFAEILPYAEHWPRYQLADLFLDTFWHNAHTTAADALWQGLPVITCAGEVASSRPAASLLHALGMPKLVTTSLEEYQKLAIYYANNRSAREAMREKLKAARYTAPLFNIPLTVRHLEEAFRLIWQRYQAGLPPASIDVPQLDMKEIKENIPLERTQ